MRFSTVLILAALVVLVSTTPTPTETKKEAPKTEHKKEAPKTEPKKVEPKKEATLADGKECSKKTKCSEASYCAFYDAKGSKAKKPVCTKKNAAGSVCISQNKMCVSGTYCKRDKPKDKKDLKGKCTPEVKKTGKLTPEETAAVNEAKEDKKEHVESETTEKPATGGAAAPAH